MPAHSDVANHADANRQYRSGLVSGVLAFGWWAVVFPLLLVAINARVAQLGYFDQGRATRFDWSLEFMAHRALWSTATCTVLLAWLGRWRQVGELARSPRSMLLLGGTAMLVLGNWTGFVYGAATDRLSHASLGYYINPLVSVALGVLVLGERLRKVQALAVLLAALGVAWETWRLGSLPWISLLVAFAFGLYGLFRKQINATAVPGLFIEGVWMLPLAGGYLGYRWAYGPPLAFGTDAVATVLLLFSGVATAAPLIWFANAAKRLPLSTLAFLQFIVPTGQLLVAVTLNGEHVSAGGMITFVLIWLGVAAFLADVRTMTGSRRRASAERGLAECP